VAANKQLDGTEAICRSMSKRCGALNAIRRSNTRTFPILLRVPSRPFPARQAVEWGKKTV